MRCLNAIGSWRRCVHSQSAAYRSVRWRQPGQIAATVQARSCSCSAPQASETNRTTTPDPPVPPADHRAIGTSQELFITSPYSPGSPLFLPNGTHIINKLIAFLRAQYKLYGFQEVLTPSIYKKSLWETSGHWDNYKDDMYEVRGRGASCETKDGEIGEDESYGLKPMNCPGHCLLFKAQRHSSNELPIRYADFSPLHRNEISGALSGLTRVRRFHQDDGHIFCRPQQIADEISHTLTFVDGVMKVFNLGSYKLVLSTRPEKDFIGSQEEWDEAELQLKEALDRSEKEWSLNEGDGAFYGPKIDIILRDSDGKEHQTATIQLDFNLPKRFGLEYSVHENAPDHDSNTPGRARPVLIHRAILGSLERFFALLIEHYNGRWPFWLSPRQGIVLTVNQDEEVVKYSKRAQSQISGYSHSLMSKGYSSIVPLSPIKTTFSIDLDSSARPLGKKIREAKQKKYNLIFVVGEKNLNEETVDIDLSGQFEPDTNLKQLHERHGHGLRSRKRTFPRPLPGLGDNLTYERDIRIGIHDVYRLLISLDKNFF